VIIYTSIRRRKTRSWKSSKIICEGIRYTQYRKNK